MNLELYQPHENQIKIHKSKAKYRVAVCGRRFGKTCLALNESIARAFQLENQIIWIILPLLKQAKEVYWIDPDVTKYFMPYVQNGVMKKNDSELSLHVPKTNSWIRLKGSDNPEGLRGSGLDLVVWDEVADVKKEAFDIIKPSLADSPYHRELYIGTPKGLNWFHDFALQGDRNGIIPTFEKPIKLNKDWETWHFTSYDNKTWPEGSFEHKEFVKFIDEERRLAEEKGKLAFFNQEYMASFEESAGRFFPKWSYKTHVLDAPIVPSEKYERYGSIDWGRSAPMAWLCNIVKHENFEGIKFDRIITFEEVYGSNKSPYEQAVLINKQVNYKTVNKTRYDPSMDTKQDDGSISVADQFRFSFEELNGERPQLLAASNKRVSRWAAMENWMRMAPDGLPYWMITPNCKNLIRTIPEMMSDENDIEDIDTSLEDHAVDSVSYFIVHQQWIDAKVGGVGKTEGTKPMPTANIDPVTGRQIPIDLDKFANAWGKTQRHTYYK